MPEKNTLAKFTDILIWQLGVHPEQCVPDARIVDDLDADSLDCVEIEMAAEEEFCITIPDGGFDKLKTVRDWITNIESLQLNNVEKWTHPQSDQTLIQVPDHHGDYNERRQNAVMALSSGEDDWDPAYLKVTHAKMTNAELAALHDCDG